MKVNNIIGIIGYCVVGASIGTLLSINKYLNCDIPASWKQTLELCLQTQNAFTITMIIISIAGLLLIAKSWLGSREDNKQTTLGSEKQ